MFTSTNHLKNFLRAQELLKDPALRDREFWVHDWRSRQSVDRSEKDPTGLGVYAGALVAVLCDDRMDDSVNSLPYLVQPCPMLKPDDYGRDEESCRTNSRYSKVKLYGDDEAREAIDKRIAEEIERLTKGAKSEAKLAKKWANEARAKFPKLAGAALLFRTKRVKSDDGPVDALELVVLDPNRLRVRGFGLFMEEIKQGEVAVRDDAAQWLKAMKARDGRMSLELFDTEEGVVIAGLFYNMYNLFGRRNVSVNGKSVEKLLALATPLKSSKAIKL
jgi:hypothetical protein